MCTLLRASLVLEEILAALHCVCTSSDLLAMLMGTETLRIHGS